jgi:flagellar protein FlaG
MDVFTAVNNVARKMDSLQHIEHKEKSVQKMQQEALQTHQSSKDMTEKSREELKKEMKKLESELNEAMNPLNQNLLFKFNDKADVLIMEVIDKKSNEVIRQFPPQDAIKLMEKMKELVGILFDKKG